MITVIIPNFNGMKFLPDCIASLKKQTAGEFEILIVDNGSKDGSLEWIKEEKTKDTRISLIELPENKGFAGGVNAGLRAADSEFVILLNNDTVAEPDFIEKLYERIKDSEDIFAVSAQMIKASDHSLIDSAGDGITWVGWAYQRGIDEKTELYQNEKDVFSACAGAAIYRKKIIDEIGLFDEMHFAYLEDVDLSWRARLAGYRIIYLPSAKVYHLGSATSGSKYNAFKVRLSSRNNIYLHYKNQPTVQLIINFIPLWMGVLGKGVFFKRKGFKKEYWDGVKEGLDSRKECHRAPRAKKGFITYLSIEGKMIAGLMEYTCSFIRRHLWKNIKNN